MKRRTVEVVTSRSRLTRAESQARTRAALLDAAARVFVERGLAGASVEAIATEAGFTRGAFYANFESKGHLYSQLLQDRVYARYRAQVEAVLDGNWNPTPREAAMAMAEVQSGDGDRWMYRLWLELLAASTREPALREMVAEFWRGNRLLLAELIRRRYAATGAEPSVDPKVLATAMIAMDVGLALQHHADPDEVGLDAWPAIWTGVFEPLDRGS